MNKESEIVLLCSDGPSSRAIYNVLTDKFGELTVVLERPVSRLEMAKRRAKKLGYLEVAGQIMFVALVVPVLTNIARKRISQIKLQFGLREDWGAAQIVSVENVNSDETIQLLRELKPRLTVVNGTRIVSSRVLESVNSVFINTHAGITPLFRGVHGGYWALAEGRSELVGTTVHFVDKGIDTGKIIAQAYFKVTEMDNFATYPYLHTAYGIPILISAVEDGLQGKLEAKEGNGLPSMLRYHPTIWEYFLRWLRTGVN